MDSLVDFTDNSLDLVQGQVLFLVLSSQSQGLVVSLRTRLVNVCNLQALVLQAHQCVFGVASLRTDVNTSQTTDNCRKKEGEWLRVTSHEEKNRDVQKEEG